MTQLHAEIRLLGDFCLVSDGRPLAVGTARVQSLIGYLALHRAAPQPRAQVAFLFWPDSTEAQAFTNLRHLLHELRATLPASCDCIRTDKRTLSWNADTPVVLDVAAFESALARADPSREPADEASVRAALEAAVELYRGELLSGCGHEWILPERERLRQRCIGALQRLAGLLENTRDYSAALRHAERWRQLEPAHEAPYCTLMRLHLLMEDRAAALQVYRQCVDALQRELSVGPGPAVRDWHDRILAGGFPKKSSTEPAPGVESAERPLHGRQREWQTLRHLWSEAAQGRPQAVVILGEAGIGKSRLAGELCTWVERQGGAAVARTRAYAAEGRLAFAPVAQWLRTEALRPNAGRLEAVWRANVAQVLPELRVEARAVVAGAPAGQQGGVRHCLFEGLARAVLAAPSPVLLLLDDMQWTDHDTLEWLHFLIRFTPKARLLVVGTVRTEELAEDHPLQRLLFALRREDQVTEIQLGPLSAVEVARVAADVAGRRLSDEDAARLHRDTQGNPLFVVETVRAGWRENAATDAVRTDVTPTPGAAASLPPKVYAVLATRLAQVSPLARELAGVAAVIGRAFGLDLLAGISGRAEDEIVPAVDELWQRRILHEPGVGLYDFTHDKLRDVAYAQLPAPRRSLLHLRSAEGLERLHAANLDPVWAQMAAHFEASGKPAQALAAYRRAGETAKRVHADEEAIRLYQKALAVLETLPSSPERTHAELELNTALGVCLVGARGYPDRSVWRVYERAVELCRVLNRPTAAPILRALAIASLASGQVRRAHGLGQELLALHRHEADPVVYVEAEYVLGVSDFWLGRLGESRTHLEEVVACYDPRRREAHLALYAQDPQAICLCRLAWTLWYLGRDADARARLEEALAAAWQAGHPHTHAYVLYFSAAVSVDMNAEPRALELLDELERLTAKHTFLFWGGVGRILRCLVEAAHNGDLRKIREAEEHMVRSAKAGYVVNFSQLLGLKARAHHRRGALREGLAAIDEAFAWLERIDERYYVPELHRLRGEFLRAAGAPSEAEACIRQALQVAREQQNQAAERRAAASLAAFGRSGRSVPAVR